MGGMFYDSEFNRDISNWDVSNVTNGSKEMLKKIDIKFIPKLFFSKYF